MIHELYGVINIYLCDNNLETCWPESGYTVVDRIIGTLGKYDQRSLILFKNHKNLTFHWIVRI